MTPQQILAEIDHLRRELALAADDLLSAAEQGLALAQAEPLDAEATTAASCELSAGNGVNRSPGAAA